MADNYLQFSFNVELESPEEWEWLEHRLAVLRAKSNVLGEALGFDYSFDEDKLGNDHVWFYAEESGDPDALAKLLQDFLKKFYPAVNKAIAFTWSITCSKMRLNEFTGGGVCITAKGATWINADHAHTLAGQVRDDAAQKRSTRSPSARKGSRTKQTRRK